MNWFETFFYESFKRRANPCAFFSTNHRHDINLRKFKVTLSVYTVFTLTNNIFLHHNYLVIIGRYYA
ncbi:hypothetical protein L1987_01516 [Smallanthus sonchifolius]|uniref:Uncharacterized protein n=1 Tax=Smallanthus sonchifolius TaxID=185202 RepID=A0ACB9K5F0_9ASTR|nr:hypothetical protein L1987_01516 [Smallanthus sonchifolius]